MWDAPTDLCRSEPVVRSTALRPSDGSTPLSDEDADRRISVLVWMCSGIMGRSSAVVGASEWIVERQPYPLVRTGMTGTLDPRRSNPRRCRRENGLTRIICPGRAISHRANEILTSTSRTHIGKRTHERTREPDECQHARSRAGSGARTNPTPPTRCLLSHVEYGSLGGRSRRKVNVNVSKNSKIAADFCCTFPSFVTYKNRVYLQCEFGASLETLVVSPMSAPSSKLSFLEMELHERGENRLHGRAAAPLDNGFLGAENKDKFIAKRIGEGWRTTSDRWKSLPF